MYEDRNDASIKIIEKLQKYKGKKGVVMGIPRGGVPIAYNVAKALDFDLDLAMIKKIGHPLNSELAIGAVSIKDNTINNRMEFSSDYIKSETVRLQEKLKDNYKKFTGREKPAYDLGDKTVVLTDDGIATGNTMLATIELIKRENPKEIIVAVPVAPPRIVRRFEEIIDEVICPLQPKEFMAVGQFYQKFDQTDDEEVVELFERFQNVNH